MDKWVAKTLGSSKLHPNEDYKKSTNTTSDTMVSDIVRCMSTHVHQTSPDANVSGIVF